MSANTQYLNRTEFARHIGSSKSYITKLGHQGRLVFGQGEQSGLIDVEATKKLLAATTGAPERAAVTTAPYADARETREHYQAQMARLDYEERVRSLLPLSDVRAVVQSAAAALRARLEQIPDVLSPQLAAISDEQRVRATLAEEIEAALSELTRQLTKVEG